MRENIYINKTGENKYEIITKEISFEPGVYTLYNLEKNLFVVKKQVFGDNTKAIKEQQYLPKDEPSEITKIENQAKEVKEVQEKQEQDNTNREESTQEWYKKALDIKKELNQNQFLVIKDLEEVRKLSFVTKQEINSGEILGIRGFDKNYYVFKKPYFETIKEKILESMTSDPVNYDFLLDKTKVSKEELNGTLEILKEQSELVELKKGLFKKM